MEEELRYIHHLERYQKVSAILALRTFAKEGRFGPMVIARHDVDESLSLFTTGTHDIQIRL